MVKMTQEEHDKIVPEFEQRESELEQHIAALEKKGSDEIPVNKKYEFFKTISDARKRREVMDSLSKYESEKLAEFKSSKTASDVLRVMTESEIKLLIKLRLLNKRGYSNKNDFVTMHTLEELYFEGHREYFKKIIQDAQAQMVLIKNIVDDSAYQDAEDYLEKTIKKLGDNNLSFKEIYMTYIPSEKLYLLSKKHKHPERDRFNPFIINGLKFDEFVAEFISQHKQDLKRNYSCQCVLNLGHSTMIELRVVAGKKTAIVIDAAGALQMAQESYIPTLIKNGFNVKVFVSDFDKKMLTEQEYDADGPVFNKSHFLATHKTLFGPVNFFRRIEPLHIQNDSYSCSIYSMNHAIQAGKTDFMKGLSIPSMRTRVFLQREKINFLRHAFVNFSTKLNPLKIEMLPFSSLPNGFIKTAQSSRIIKHKFPQRMPKSNDNEILVASSKKTIKVDKAGYGNNLLADFQARIYRLPDPLPTANDILDAVFDASSTLNLQSARSRNLTHKTQDSYAKFHDDKMEVASDKAIKSKENNISKNPRRP